MASSGIKRPFQDETTSNSGRSDRSHDEGRRSKPKDWRDAFLHEDEQPRRGERDRDRGDHRRRDDYRDRDREGDRDRDRDDRRRGYDDRYRDRRRDGGSYGERDYREREPARGGGDHSRRHGDRRDRRRDDRDDRSYRHRDYPDKEEGELDPSPAKSSIALPMTSPSRALVEQVEPPKPGHISSRPIPAGPREVNQAAFQSVSLPPQSRTTTSSNRIPSHNRFFPTGGETSRPQQPKVEDVKRPEFDAKPEEEEPVVVLEEERDPEKVLEERRRKREEIMAKFRANGGKATASTTPKIVVGDLPGPGTGAESVTSAGTRTGYRTGTASATGATPLMKQLGTRSTSVFPSGTSAPTPITGHEPSLASTPLGHDFDLTKQAEAADRAVILQDMRDNGVGADMIISAADYDPTLEAMADREKRQKDMDSMKVDAKDIANGVGEPIVVVEDKIVVEDEYEEIEIEEEDEDDEFDMFAAFGDEEKEKKKRKVVVKRLKNGSGANGNKAEVVKKPASTIQVADNLDDSDGYYRITPGEILDDGRYQITITLGKGMFSAVVKAKVLKAVGQERRQDVVGKEVAIKVIRSQESMYVAGRKEAQILKKLNDADPEDKKHIVRLERTFEHRGHLCIVTESLSMNLRDVIKRFGKDVGLNMRAVRAYAHQMFLALSLMRKCSVVHADLKPDNVLVSENKATLKVCDLGSAAEITEGEITPYLVSRFYRAPEIILGLPYDTAIDIWSVGCTLYELYTGKILFPGRSNNHMLLLMMELKGKLNHRMIKKATFGSMHFDETMNFISIEKDKITGQDVAKTLVISKASKDLKARLLPPSSVQLKMKDEELKPMLNFVDLIDKCLQLDPTRRITPRDALLHPFLAG
ncbi:hypothetical protein IAR55_000897 [Kwoniella newhampshirensis]|uniref:non-specific serine/threonine protein kinase n=1 Tax=Kwoniella newhampshirensis TaxID=1651941 RepID=A0AAW0Z457_9TREE